MGGLDVIKALFIPAAIAGSLYALISYLLLPLIRKHRSRYDQYLPVQAISSTSTTLRDRFLDFVSRITLRRRHRVVDGSALRRDSSDDNIFGDEEGESMVGFDVNQRERNVRGGRVEVVTSDRRLSRDLEEGFKDSDDDSSDDERGRRGR